MQQNVASLQKKRYYASRIRQSLKQILSQSEKHMKKALIALSVAAGMIASAQAENTTTLYGSLGFEVQAKKENNQSLAGVKDNKWNLDTTTAKFGIKGTEDLSNGLQAFFKFEFNANNKGIDDTRYAYVGLTGNFGMVTFGKQDSLYKLVTNKNDIFQNTYWNNHVTNYQAAAGGSRLAKAISYVSPNFNGFQFGIAGVLDGDHNVVSFSDSKNFAAYQVGAWYKQNGFYAGVAYSSLDAATLVDLHKSVDVVGGAVGYSNDQFQVHLGVQHKSGNDLVAETERVAYSDGIKYNLAGEYYSGPNTFRAGFGVADLREAKFDDNVYTYALGYQYNFSKRTYTYVEGDYTDWNKQFGHERNGYSVRVGLRHDF